jgi:hypothetical protein
MVPSNQAETLSGNLVPFVSQPDISMMIAQLQDTHWAHKTEQGLEMEVGSVHFRITDVLHGSSPRPGDLIEVPAKRVASPTIRVRNRSNYWNALRLNLNDNLILACRPTDDPRVWNAAAARQISSPAEGDVAAVRQAYEIEQFSGTGPQRLKMLAAALQGDLDLLSRYALDYLERQASTQRDSAVQLLHDAILSSKTPADRKVNFALALVGQAYLIRDRKADAVNQMIVGTIATGLVNEDDSARRSTWARILASSVLMEFSPDPQEASQIRSSLTRSPQNPPAARVNSVLSDVMAHATGDEKEMVSQLLKAWHSSGH